VRTIQFLCTNSFLPLLPARTVHGVGTHSNGFVQNLLTSARHQSQCTYLCAVRCCTTARWVTTVHISKCVQLCLVMHREHMLIALGVTVCLCGSWRRATGSIVPTFRPTVVLFSKRPSSTRCFLQCLTLQMKALPSFESALPADPMSRDGSTAVITSNVTIISQLLLSLHCN